ncbi:Rossmann-like and DUF2520 domain-containing protein [Lutibacter sp.]
MIKVVILGGGNVAFHLTKHLLKSNAVTVAQVYNRNLSSIAYLKNEVPITSNINELKEADVYIIAVADNAIAPLSSQLICNNKLVVHTSGGSNLNELKSQSNKGVFYPLQTFSKDREVDFSTIPICIEATNNNDLKLLELLAATISKKIYHINSKQREKLHVAAVFVNNFVNHLYKIGHDICEKEHIPFEILQPLIKETSQKINELTPLASQTGPAKRNDTKTIKKHMAMLTKNQQEIYTLLTNSIYNTYGKKL